VPEDQLSLAIGKKGQNVRLTAKLTHWHIDIMTEEQARKVREMDRAEIYKIPCLAEGVHEKLLLNGVVSLRQIVAKGAEHFETMYSLSPEQAATLIAYAKKREEEVQAERAAALTAQAEEKQAAAALAASAEQALAQAASAEQAAQAASTGEAVASSDKKPEGASAPAAEGSAT